jgi:ligand-binding SRPBCC domain-containing protein
VPTVHVLEREQILRDSRPSVFAFFAEASNLERLTPRELSFHILTPRPIPMKQGTLIDYRLRLLGVPFAWQTLIEVFEPDVRFVDVQLKGPYALWRHTHTFEDVREGTRMLDRVEYALPLGPLGGIAHALFVEKQLRTIFDHRRKVIGELFGS